MLSKNLRNITMAVVIAGVIPSFAYAEVTKEQVEKAELEARLLKAEREAKEEIIKIENLNKCNKITC